VLHCHPTVNSVDCLLTALAGADAPQYYTQLAARQQRVVRLLNVDATVCQNDSSCSQRDHCV